MPHKILIAEDEKPLANALRLKLVSAGFDAEVVHNGEEALEAIKNGNYAFMLMDIMMPKLDGFAVLAELQKTHDTTPVFVMSNLSQNEDVDRIKELGAKDYIVKSNTPLAQIVERVAAFLKTE